jgi:hypothetical protein
MEYQPKIPVYYFSFPCFIIVAGGSSGGSLNHAAVIFFVTQNSKEKRGGCTKKIDYRLSSVIFPDKSL